MRNDESITISILRVVLLRGSSLGRLHSLFMALALCVVTMLVLTWSISAEESGANDEQLIKASSGVFELVAVRGEKVDSDTYLEIRVKGTFITTGKKFYAESEIALPQSGSKEKYSLLLDSSTSQYFIIYHDTLNYQRIKTAEQELKAIFDLLPSLKSLDEERVVALMKGAGFVLRDVGTKKVEGEMYKVKNVSWKGSKNNEVVRDSDKIPSLNAELYFTMSGRLNILAVRFGDWHIKLTLLGIKRVEVSKEKLEIPMGYYEMQALELSLGASREVEA